MRTELNHVMNPSRTNIMWTLFYVALAAIVIGGFLLIAGRIRSYSMPAGSVQLSIPYKTYLVGEPITFTLTNNYNSAIYIANDCPGEPLAVYRKEKSMWMRIHAETTELNCHDRDRQIRVGSGEMQSGSYSDWVSLFQTPGQYRVVAYVEYFNIAPYQDFEVITKPTAASSASSATGVSSPSLSNSTTPSTATATSTTGSSLKSKTVSVSNGKIYATYSSTTVYVQSIVPKTGCTYEGGGSGREVKVKFVCGSSETQIELWVSGGQVRTEIEHGD